MTKKEQQTGSKTCRKRHRTGSVLLIIVLIVAIALLAWNAWNIWKINSTFNEVEQSQEETQLVEDEVEPMRNYRKQWNDRYEENNDFLGWIRFDSGLINLPFVWHPSDPDYYVHRGFNQQYYSSGAIWLNPRQTIDNRLFAIYGHLVYANQALMFSPLDQLLDEANYEDNSTFKLYLEHEVRSYKVAAVVKHDSQNDDWNYEQDSYTDKELHDFLAYAKKNRLYDTGVDMPDDGRYVVLQTCILHNKYVRTVIVGIETGTEVIEE